MAQEKADEATGAAGPDEDTPAVLTDDRAQDADGDSKVSITKDAEADEDLDDIDDDFDDDEFDDARSDGPGQNAFLATLGVAVVAVLGVLFLLGAYVWPAFLGPGSPQEVADRAVSAISAKDPAQLNDLQCVRLDGTPTAPFPLELLPLVGGATGAGAPVQSLDNETRAPMDLTLAQGAERQTLPADLVFHVTDGNWCLNEVQLRQQ